MIYLKSILVGFAAMLIAFVLLVGIALVVTLVRLRWSIADSGSGGIGAVSVGVNPFVLAGVVLMAMLAFAAGFWWEFRRSSRLQ